MSLLLNQDRAPQVSVIVPVYNAVSTIVETLQSIVNTNWPNLQIVIVDDVSNDGSIEQINNFISQHPSTSIILASHPGGENRGAAESRNYGAQLATGKYLAFLDADDIYQPYRFSSSIPLLEEEQELAAVFGCFQYTISSINGNERVRDVGPEHLCIDPEQLPKKEKQDYLSQLLSGVVGLHISTVTIRTDVFNDIGGFPKLKYAEDQAMWLRLFAKYSVDRVTGNPISIYRIHENSLCSGGEQDPRFIFGPILSRLNAVTWLQNNGGSNNAIEQIKQTIPGRLFHQYPKVQQGAWYIRLYMLTLLMRVAWVMPSILVNKQPWSISVKLLLSLITKQNNNILH